MYYSHGLVKKKLTNSNDKKKVVLDYVDGLETLIKLIDKNHLREDNDPDETKNIKSMVNDLVKSLDYFENTDVIKHIKNDNTIFGRFKNIVGKIITRDLFVEDIRIQKDKIIKLLDHIEWDCGSLLEHGEDWMSDETDCGYNILTIMDLAKKYKKQIRVGDCIYALLIAITINVKGSDDAVNYIIDNGLRVKKNFDDPEGLVDDVIDLFREKNYELIDDQ